MTTFQVTRAHLKHACDSQNWDLLDKLLTIDNKQINDNALYTDGWGEWWGLLLECVYNNQVDGVRVLLKHGAKKQMGNWGDCLEITPLEAATDKPEILRLLQAKTRPDYTRQSDPPLPPPETAADQAINQQGRVRDKTGLVFPTDSFDKSGREAL